MSLLKIALVIVVIALLAVAVAFVVIPIPLIFGAVDSDVKQVQALPTLTLTPPTPIQLSSLAPEASLEQQQAHIQDMTQQVAAYTQSVTAYTQSVTAYSQQVAAYKARTEFGPGARLVSAYRDMIGASIQPIATAIVTALLGALFVKGAGQIAANQQKLAGGKPETIESFRLW